MEFRRIAHDSVDSTNERAFAALADGTARHGDVHVAVAQTQGRGRRGRGWESTRGEGLYLSLVLRPPALIAPATLSVAAGLAVLDTLGSLGVRGASLKWPNDVLCAGAKLAGVLIETRGLDARAPHYVVGIGVNVAQSSFSRELERERAVTSLLMAGARTSVQDCERTLLAHLAVRFDLDAERLGADYLTGLGLEGCRVRLDEGSGEWIGEIVGFDLARGFTVSTDRGVRAVALEGLRSVERAS